MTQLRRATLTADAHEAIRAMLLDDTRFRPGQKISVEELSRELGVSRSPVWNAIARLEAEGLVDVSPRQGVFLVGFDASRLQAMYEAREALEGMAARLAVVRMATGELHALDANLAEQERCLGRDDPVGYAAAALAFHTLVLRGAQNPLIEQQLGDIYARSSAMCRGRPGKGTVKALEANHQDHAALLDALRRRSEGDAEALARKHVRRLMNAALDGAGQSTTGHGGNLRPGQTSPKS